MNTVKFMHLNKSLKYEGDIIQFGELVGEYGDSGFSTAPHLHIGCIKGYHDNFTLLEIENGKFQNDYDKLKDFINNDLFKAPYKITTEFLEEGYKTKYGQGLYEHHGLDVVNLDRLKTNFYWNQYVPGKVVKRGVNDMAGLYLVIQFDDDITGHWAEESMKWLIESGRMEGYPDGTFKPDEPLSRAEYCQSEYRRIQRKAD